MANETELRGTCLWVSIMGGTECHRVHGLWVSVTGGTE